MQHTHVDFSSMEKPEVSKTLYGQIQWEQLPSSGVFLQHKDHQLLERAQANLAVVLDNQQDAKDYVSILLKIAENCTTNVGKNIVVHRHLTYYGDWQLEKG
ncbi:hypothetical protein EON63_18725 [archaeon]|nr:MAG: hypothetical protein EON63_18725 [archaeon]